MNDLKEKSWEKLLKISSCGRDDTHSDTYRYPYEPTPYSVLERLANSGLIGKKNLLIDYGCGKGRVDFFMSFQTGCRAIGIEYDDRIYEKALENKSKTVSGVKTEFCKADATEYEVPAQADRFYFFNPFSVELLRKVLGRIWDSFYDNPREMYLFFYFPSDEYLAYLMTEEALEFFDEIDCSDLFAENSNRERIMIFRTTMEVEA